MNTVTNYVLGKPRRVLRSLASGWQVSTRLILVVWSALYSIGYAEILTVDKAIDLFLENSFDVKIEHTREQKAQYDTQAYLGIYDFITKSKLTYFDIPQISVASSQGAAFFTNISGVSVENSLSKRFPFGVEFSIEHKPNFTEFGLVPRPDLPGSIKGYEQTLALKAKASLLKNLFGEIDYTKIAQLKGNEIVAKLRTLIAIEEIFKEGIDLYRLWYIAKRSKVFRQQSLNRARALLKIDQQKLKDGLIEKGELAQSQVGVESRKIELEDAIDQLNQINHTFSAFLNISKKQMDRYDIPNLSKEVRSYPAISDQELSSRNLTIVLAKANHKISALSVFESEYDRKPEFNVFSEFGLADAGAQFQESLDDLFFKNPNYAIGFELEIPLGNTTKLAQHRQKLLAKTEAELEVDKNMKVISENYHSTLSSLKSLRQRISNMQRLLRLQKVKVNDESKKYNQGRSSIDLVLRFQNELTEFELQLTQFLGDFIKKWIELQLTDTSLMRSHKLKIPNVDTI